MKSKLAITKPIKAVGVWDWKERPYYDIKNILKKFGINMYELPSLEGSDMYGFLFTNKKMNKKEIEEFDCKEFGDDEDNE